MACTKEVHEVNKYNQIEVISEKSDILEKEFFCNMNYKF
jgi:hypothetical protein